MSLRLLAVCSACLALSTTAPAMADVLDDAAVQAEPQYYLMSLTDTPAQDVADAVLGDALGLPFKVDPAVTARISFKVDGLYGPRALVRELADRLWNADVALIERPSDGLWLIPKAALPAALAQGAALVAAPAGATAAPVAAAPALAPRPIAPKTTAAKAPPSDTPDLSWLLALGVGWLAGVGSVFAWLRLRRPTPAPVLALPSPVASSPPEPAADDLVIPTFAQRAATVSATSPGA
ncbi:hypothetical protein ACIQC9_08515 [Brevundimonas sp. NPDC092305]|uniref:hypothetical protein n=1 Tax=Brevundimonas sp. NPDC092305 TaxID=3363957 RepID=UPI003801FE35